MIEVAIVAQAKDVAGDDVDGLDLNIYNTSTYIFIGISAIVVIISFFGCCGAWKVKNYFLLNFLALTGALIVIVICYRKSTANPLLEF